MLGRVQEGALANTSRPNEGSRTEQHQRITRRVAEQLRLEFDAVPGADVEREAVEAVDVFRDARVRDFVSVLALRHARNRLRARRTA
jgi:hypothetical protein